MDIRDERLARRGLKSRPAADSRYFWGLRLHLVCTLHGLPVAFALAGAKADERDVLRGMLTAGPDLVAARPGQTLIGDKNYYGADFEAAMAAAGITLLRPARKGEPALTAAIWHNDTTGQPVLRSLVAYDH